MKIGAYLDELGTELRARRTPRRRFLAEAEDHLRSTAEELVACGRPGADAEREAIERFGAAAEVAQRFAVATAASTARSAVAWAAAAFLAYSAAALVFLASAPVWLRDFPHGAPSMLALQVGAVAIAATGVRVLRWRRGLAPDEERLRLVANGALTATVAVAAGAAAELVVALTRPAAAPWGDAVAPIATFALAAALCLAASLPSAASRRQTSRLGHRRESGLTLADDVEAVAPFLGRPVGAVLDRPGLACAGLAVPAFAAVAVVQLLASNRSFLLGAATVGVLEATAIVVGFLTLGRPLGLRRES